jgi:hypothetical protein
VAETATTRPLATATPGVRRRRLAVPAPLAALLAVAAIFGVCWALVLPAWQAPDENSHYGYVQSLVDGPGLPGVANRPSLATEQGLASDAVNADQTAASLVTKPEWNPGAFRAWQRTERTLPHSQRSDGGGANAARSNPPLAYVAYALPYAATSGTGVFTRLTSMRLFGVLWLLVTVAATWALAGEVFGPRPILQLVAAAVPALTPMPAFISASVGPDGLLFATWTLALWLGARMLRRGPTPALGAWFLGAVGLACWVKATSYALLPGALAAFALALWRSRRLGARRGLALAVPGAAALVGIVGGWIVLARILARPASEQLTSVATASGLNLRELGSYLWQFYLPRLPFMHEFFASLNMTIPVYDTVLKGTWARFGWLEVVFPEPVYWLLSAVTLVVSGAAVASLWRARRTLDKAVLGFFAVIALTLLAGLHWQEYRLILAGAGPFMQGRYLLPLVGLAGLMAAAALRVLPVRAWPLAVAVSLAGLFALQAFSLGLTLERFYA